VYGSFEFSRNFGKSTVLETVLVRKLHERPLQPLLDFDIISVVVGSIPVVALCIPLLAQDATLEHARQVNLDRAAHMPNFVADEIVTHYFDRRGVGAWEHDFTAKDEITVQGNKITRKHVHFNRSARSWSRIAISVMGRARLPAVGWGLPATGFAAALQPLFDPNCRTLLESAGNDELRGKAVVAYRFDSPFNGCFGNLYGGYPYNAARTGRILIDGPSGDLLQFEEEAFGFPRDFAFVSRHQVMDWDYVKIGGASHLLPVSAEFIWTTDTSLRIKADVEYKNHRHFESSSDIRYK